MLVFGKFSDGRSFSYAEILRERFDFSGELRAGGDVLLDEIPLMLRCGFDFVRGVNEPTLRALRRGHLPGVVAVLPAEQRSRRGRRGHAALAQGDEAVEGLDPKANPASSSRGPLGRRETPVS